MKAPQSRSEPGAESGAESGPAPSTRYVGLLTQIMTNTLDEDYETVARKKPPLGALKRSRHVGLWVVVAIFGVMIGVSALKTERDRPAANAEREQLVVQIHTRENRLNSLHRDLATLQARVADLQQYVTTQGSTTRAMSGRTTMLGISAGTMGVTGPGVVVTVDNAKGAIGGANGGVILDTDLQALVNGMWASGAEAISINGHRLTGLTAIRHAGKAITVDYRSLTPPYTITVVGDADTLPATFLDTAGGQVWLGLHANFGIAFDIVAQDHVTVPGDPRSRLLYARSGGPR